MSDIPSLIQVLQPSNDEMKTVEVVLCDELNWYTLYAGSMLAGLREETRLSNLCHLLTIFCFAKALVCFAAWFTQHSLSGLKLCCV